MFDITNSIRYTGKETADTAFSKVLVKNCFKDNTFKPGITYSDKYQERAGQILTRMLGKTKAHKGDATQEGGLDFQHTQTEDKLLTIVKKDVLSRSEKIYQLIDELRSTGKSVDKVAQVVAEWTEGFQELCMGYLLAAPKEEGGGATRSSNTTASTSSETLIKSVLGDRKQIRVAGGTADVLIISPDAEEFLLADFAVGKGFIPETNEEALREGKLGRIFGMNVFTSNLIGSSNEGDAGKCEYVIYDHDTLGIAADIEGLRLKEDDGSFVGSFAQIMSVMGGIVANPALAIAKIVA